MEEFILPILGVAYGSVFIWLIVRIVNQPKQWDQGKSIAVCLLVVPVFGTLCLLPVQRGSRPASRRSQCKNNLKQIGLALHNYHETFGSFPPAFIADASGRPMHSWRVLLLPFLDQAPLYNQYRFDEPWDGPHNRKLGDTILQAYSCPSDDHGGTGGTSAMTSYVAVVGPETMWPDRGAVAIRDVSDGTLNTLLVVEVANSGIPWIEPRDLHVVQMAPTINAKSGQGISSRHATGANVLIADGSVRFVPENLSAAELFAWLTAHAGDLSKDF
jgi:prepilin-type processing-associated H-X9-DG protein